MKPKATYLSFSLLFLSAALLFPTILGALTGAMLSKMTVAERGEEKIIILDAGHGGRDSGAVGTNGALEKNLNLSVTRTLADLFCAAGYTVVETRKGDELLADPVKDAGHLKREDLKNRVASANKHENAIFVSIHMNTFPTKDCRGVQVWYSENNKESLPLARAVQERIAATLQPENHRRVKAATSSIYVLRHTAVPAILIECGFLSTPDECERLCDPAYQKGLALVFFAAIAEKIEKDACTPPSDML